MKSEEANSKQVADEIARLEREAKEEERRVEARACLLFGYSWVVLRIARFLFWMIPGSWSNHFHTTLGCIDFLSTVQTMQLNHPARVHTYVEYHCACVAYILVIGSVDFLDRSSSSKPQRRTVQQEAIEHEATMLAEVERQTLIKREAEVRKAGQKIYA